MKNKKKRKMKKVTWKEKIFKYNGRNIKRRLDEPTKKINIWLNINYAL